mgnify:CR=1 FL=1
MQYRRHVRLGVLDVGSNTVHLLLVDAHYGGAPVPASKLKIPLKLAEHMNSDGSIDDDAVQQLTDFIRESVALAEDMGATEVMAFATSAIRDATNSESVLATVNERTGLSLEILSGEDEARLTFLAVRRWVGWSAGRVSVFDIGGGSLEIAIGTDEEPDVGVSLPIGAGRMTRAFIAHDPPKSSELKELRKAARVAIAGAAGQLRRGGAVQRAFATSKTFKQLARITGAAPSSEGPFVQRVLRLDDLNAWVPELAEMSSAQRAKIPGVSEGRSAQMVAGAIVAQAAMELLEVSELEICPWALREGVILRHLDHLDRDAR